MASPLSELNTLLQKAGFALRTDRAFLRITGPDATRWLNGMVTNSAEALAPGEGNYNFLLNAQGRIQGDATLYREPSGNPPGFLLVTSTDQLATLQTWLDRFIIMDDVELTPTREMLPTLLLLGPHAPEVTTPAAHHLGGDHAALPPLRLLQDPTVQITTPAPGLIPRFETTAGVSTLSQIQQLAQAHGAAAVSETTLEQLRLLEGTPRFATDIRNSETARDLPQETNQTHALHFAKGCYLGQEIVERIRSRGQVHRTFTAFRLEGSLPELPAPLEAAGKPVGELTSALEVPSESGPALLALGYVRREALDTKATLTYARGTAHPRAIAPRG